MHYIIIKEAQVEAIAIIDLKMGYLILQKVFKERLNHKFE
jgi:hypothetical protein